MRHYKLNRQKQNGLSMLVALIALMVIMLSTAAMVKSIESGTGIAGNLSFKQDALAAANVGAERAMSWLDTKAADATYIDVDHADAGYYAGSLDSMDPTGSNTSATNKLALVDWDNDDCASTKAGTFDACTLSPFTLGDLVNGNRIQWIITRICDSAGSPSPTNMCSRPITIATSTANDRGSLESGGRIGGIVVGPYYRIVVRATGPRNTVSFTETMVHF
jgi:type IV pilus assembly protein PilX